MCDRAVKFAQLGNFLYNMGSLCFVEYLVTGKDQLIRMYISGSMFGRQSYIIFTADNLLYGWKAATAITFFHKYYTTYSHDEIKEPKTPIAIQDDLYV